MATNLAVLSDAEDQEAAGLPEPSLLEMEHPVCLAYAREPVLRVTGVVSVIRTGRQDLALSEREWQELGLSEAPEDRPEPAEAESNGVSCE